MGYLHDDVYNQPGSFDLTFIGSIEWDDEPWQFNLTGVWIDADKNVYYGDDSGCSCPSPFEDIESADDLFKCERIQELIDYLNGRVEDAVTDRYSPRDRDELTGEVGELIVRVREAIR